MFQRLTNFIKYHNAFPIALSVILLSSGAVFAASPEARDVIISEETTVRSVDNSYIVGINLQTHDPQLQITSIEDDGTSYYVDYAYNTVTITDYVWKGFRTNKTLTVPKEVLGKRDLGLYVAEEVNEILSREQEYLSEVQVIEKNKGVTKKVATTEYSGLVGKMLSSKDEEFEGYVPIIPEERIVANTSTGGADAPVATTDNTSTQVTASVPSKEEIITLVQKTVKELLAEGTSIITTSASTSTPTTGTGDTVAPVITVIGNNPSEVAVGASYVDLGATVTDNVNNNLGISYAVDGVNVSNITIGTSIDATFIVTYSATDHVWNTGVATRTVIVGTGVTETTPEPTATTTPEAVVTLDTTAPVITIVGNNPVTVELNSVYIDEGATATDDTDGDITSSIIAINSVDTTTVGTYTVVYNVTDQVGNNAVEVTREVTVEDTTPVAPIATSTSSQ